MNVRAAVTTVAVAAVSMVGAASSAMAVASEGAFVFRQSECTSGFFVPGDQLCTTLRLNSNVARAGSGHLSVMQHGFSTAVYTDENGVVRFTAEQKLRGHLLVKEGLAHEDHFALDDFSSFTGQDCSMVIRFHTVNGRVQYDDSQVVCTP